jgi:hypothetical protein
MAEAADEAGYVEVRLTGADEIIATPATREQMNSLNSASANYELLPLADWRARSVPAMPDELLMLAHVGKVDSVLLNSLSRAGTGNAVPALRYGDVLLLPTTDSERGILRAVQCGATDPVSMALSDGRTIARFPELGGWSALASARRAVAEHRSWLSTDGWTIPPHGWIGVQSAPRDATARTLGLLFTAARAALFLESILEGAAELAVTAAGVADALTARDSRCRGLAEDALQSLRASRAGEVTDPTPFGELLDVVRKLPAYSSANAALAMQ